MQKLRLVHLYLGCIFAPMLVFFSVSGIWQTLHLQWTTEGEKPGIMAYLTTLHTGNPLRDAKGTTLSSPVFEGLNIAMAVVLITTMVLGVVMAFRFGRGVSALICLLVGIVVPILVVLAR